MTFHQAEAKEKREAAERARKEVSFRRMVKLKVG
jgi:hypothetical protein